MYFVRFGEDGREKQDMRFPRSIGTLAAPTRAALLETICDMHGLDYDLSEDEIMDRSGLADVGMEITQFPDLFAVTFEGLCAIGSADTIEEAREMVRNYRERGGLYTYYPVAVIYEGYQVGLDPEQNWPLFVPTAIVEKL